jgi:hypothetical protein
MMRRVDAIMDGTVARRREPRSGLSRKSAGEPDTAWDGPAAPIILIAFGDRGKRPERFGNVSRVCGSMHRNAAACRDDGESPLRLWEEWLLAFHRTVLHAGKRMQNKRLLSNAY